MNQILNEASSTTAAEITEEIAISTTPKFLKAHFRQYSVQLFLIVLFDLINSCTHFFLTLIIGDFFIIQFHTDSSKGKLLQKIGIEITQSSTFFLLFLFLLSAKFITGYAAKLLSVKQGEIFVKTIREALFAHQVFLPTEIFRQKSFGNYLLRYSNDMKAVQNMLTKGLLGAAKEILFLCVGITIIGIINREVSFIIAGLIIAAALLVRKITALQTRLISDSRDKRSNLLAFVSKTFSQFNKIKMEGTETKFIQRFHNKSTDLLTANISNGRTENLLQGLAGIIPFLIIGGVLWMITSKLIHIHASDGLLTILMLLLMQGTVRRLLKIPGYLVKGKISLDKIALIMQ
ncbi:hypothetical protein BH10BAC3_BH10BAC3_27640 [soil metagenome]